MSCQNVRLKQRLLRQSPWERLSIVACMNPISHFVELGFISMECFSLLRREGLTQPSQKGPLSLINFFNFFTCFTNKVISQLKISQQVTSGLIFSPFSSCVASAWAILEAQFLHHTLYLPALIHSAWEALWCRLVGLIILLQPQQKRTNTPKGLCKDSW
jgi:hypothetical protein